jgi:small subunit ribosomal protein S6
MRKYELVVLIKPNLDESGIKDEITKISSLIENNGGKNVTLKNWGRREVSHAVKGFEQAVFVAFSFETDNAALYNTIGTTLRITENVLRSQCHRVDFAPRKVKVTKRFLVEQEEFGESSIEY